MTKILTRRNEYGVLVIRYVCTACHGTGFWYKNWYDRLMDRKLRCGACFGKGWKEK